MSNTDTEKSKNVNNGYQPTKDRPLRDGDVTGGYTPEKGNLERKPPPKKK